MNNPFPTAHQAPIAPQTLTDILVLLAQLDDARILPHRTVRIGVDKVLAWSWNPGRLERCRQKLAEGEKAPAIHVNRYRLNGATWYVVADGRHRTVAAREVGRQRIAAIVGSEVVCQPARYRLDAPQGKLWQEFVDARFGSCLKFVAGDLSSDVQAGLCAVGVPLRAEAAPA